MDKCYTLLCVAVFLVSVIHGFTLGYRNGNSVAIKVLEEESVIAKQAQLPENSTFDLLDLLVLPPAAMTTCRHALKASSQQVKAAAAEFQALDAATQDQVVDDFRAQINAALRLFRSCVQECFVDGGADEACAIALRTHIRVWADAAKLYSQYLDLEINRAQLTPGWSSSSSNSSDFLIS